MIIKVCQFQANRASGEKLVQVFQPGHIKEAERFFSGMRKEAAPLLPDVRHYLERLKPHPQKIYVLVNAMGASEYWGQNINGDIFPEASLIHDGPEYGYKTFYNAHPYKHHANKNPEVSFGDVELAVWHDGMKRVELVIAIDRDRAKRFGAQDVCDKLDAGLFPDVSMGAKVPFDCCTICTDWDKYHRAQATFDPRIHQTVGRAVLAFHRRDPIRGLSVTRDDYCKHLKYELGRIYQDGSRVGAINDYPRFFDISFVFIGADKTAKVMAKLAMAGSDVIPSWKVAEMAGYLQPEEAFSKVASAGMSPGKAALAIGRETMEELMEQYSMGRLKVPEKYSPKAIFHKAVAPRVPKVSKPEEKTAAIDIIKDRLREKRASKRKRAEIVKDITPSQFGGKAVPIDHRGSGENNLPNDILDALGSCPLSSALSTPGHMGMLLKPREFQRIVIIRMGKRPLADSLDRDRALFPPSDEHDDSLGFGSGDFSSRIMKLLLPFLGERSHFEPVVKRRIIRITMRPRSSGEEGPDLFNHDDDGHYIEGDPLLDKISAAYNSYLDNTLKCIGDAASVVEGNPDLWSAIYDLGAEDCFTKTAEINTKALLGAIGGAYLLSAYARSKMRRSLAGHADPPGVIMQVLGDHPHLAAAITGMTAAHAMGSDVPKKLLSTGLDVVKSVIDGVSKTR